MAINKHGYAYPCPLNFITNGEPIFEAAEFVDNSNGNCGDKELVLFEENEQLLVQIDKTRIKDVPDGLIPVVVMSGK